MFNDSELQNDFEDFKAFMESKDIESAANILADYILIYSDHPKKHSLPIKNNVLILLRSALVPQTEVEFAFIIDKLIESVNHDRMGDFRWRLN